VNEHAINRITFDIACRNELTGQRLQQDMVHYVAPLLEHTFDTAFNAVVDTDSILAIHRLEIDLGILTPVMFSGIGMLKRLSTAIKEALQHEKENLPHKESSIVVSDEERQYQLLVYFLQHGDLPWWADKTGKIKLEELVNTIIKNNPIAWQQLLDKHLHSPVVQQRILFQLKSIIDLLPDQSSENPYAKLLQVLAQADKSKTNRYRRLLERKLLQQPGLIKQLRNFISFFEKTETQRFKKVSGGVNKKNARAILGKMTFYEIALWHSKQFPLPTNAVTIQQKTVVSFLAEQLGGLRENGIDILRDLPDVDLAYLEELFTAIKKEERRRTAQLESILANENLLQANLLQSPITQPILQRLPRKIIEKYKATIENKASRVDERKDVFKSLVEKLTDKDIEALHVLSLIPKGQFHKLLQPDIVSEYVVDIGEEKGIIVENAGLCLVAAYLPPLFRIVGLTRNETFINNKNEEKAMQLLQYIADGSQRDPEYLLQLNKILCGIRPEEPVKQYKMLHKKYTKEADDLLRSLITNWKALGNTTINGFRQSFLLRKGILKENMNGWILHVESQGHDVLLSSIPWSYSLIKLPWMKKPINVEWVAG